MLPELGDLRSLPADRAAAVVDAFVLRVTQDGTWGAARRALAEFAERPALPAGHPALVGLAALQASLAGADGDPARAAPLWAKVGRLARTHPVPQTRAVYSVRARLMRIAAGSGEPLLLRRCLDIIDALLSPRETQPVRRGHSEYVADLAVADIGGRRTLVSASSDDTVRRWDLQEAAEAGAPLPGHAGGARTLSVATLDGCPVAVVGAQDGTVHAWDLGTSAPIRAPLPLHRGAVLAVATAVADGRLIAVSSGRDGAVRAHDVVTGTTAGPAREGPPESVGPVSIARLDDRLVVVAALQDGLRGTLHAWDLRSGAPVFSPPAPHRGGPVWAISTLDDGDRVLAAFTTMGATVHVWDLRTGEPVGPAGWYPGLGLPAVALTRWSDRLVAITGGGMENGQVRMTDVAAAAWTVMQPQLVEVAGRAEQQPVPTVELCAYYAAEGRPVPVGTVPVNPYDRAVEAILAGDDDGIFAALGELLRFVAGFLDGQEDASLYEYLAGDADLTAQAELDAALLRHAADRVAALHHRISAYATSPDRPR